jgi:hypothetical protein
MEGFLAAQVDDAAVVEPAVRLPKEFLSEKNAGCKLHPPRRKHAYRSRKNVEGASDELLAAEAYRVQFQWV